MENEIKSLGEKDNPSAADTSRLVQLNAELENINKKKEEYVQEHPEQRNLVYRRKKTEDEKVKEKVMPEQRNLFNKKGLPRHPERSIYYDPVMNPYGVPPPGMPYMERPPLPGEAHSDQEDDEDDITLPKGLRPRPNEELINSDDDIPMPDGPPPSQDIAMLPQPVGPQPPIFTPLVPPPLFPTPSMALPLSSGAAVPPPPPGFPGGVPPFPPPLGFPVPHAFPDFPSAGGPAQSLGIAPPGFFPRNSQMPSSMRDPLFSVSHTTYQGYQVQRETRTTLPSHPSLPPKPVLANPGPSATVSAGPELRDLKKEATAFVPTMLKRKRPGASVTPSSKVNAAPALAGTEVSEEEPKPARPDLVSTLRDQFGPPPVPSVPNKKNDGYDKFMEEMGDILGS